MRKIYLRETPHTLRDVLRLTVCPLVFRESIWSVRSPMAEVNLVWIEVGWWTGSGGSGADEAFSCDIK